MGLDSAAAIRADQSSASAFKAIRADLLDEYRQDHNYPWIIGYSGGKDSTLVVHLVFEMLIALPPSERKRSVHIVANDTLVESPLVVQHIVDSIAEIEEAAQAFGLPVVTRITRPAPDQSFWVNLIGRGYPSPNRSFRWCTDRMKILPTSRYIIFERRRNLEAETGESFISEDETGLIHKLWAEEIASHANTRSMNVREIRKEK